MAVVIFPKARSLDFSKVYEGWEVYMMKVKQLFHNSCLLTIHYNISYHVIVEETYNLLLYWSSNWSIWPQRMLSCG